MRGAIVVETALTPTSSFQSEIKQLAQNEPSSAAWFFIDSRGRSSRRRRTPGSAKPSRT